MGESEGTSGVAGEEPAEAGTVAACDGADPLRDAAAGDEDSPGRGTWVEKGEIRQLSVSSIAKGDPEQPGGCHRRWWYRYVARLPDPPGPAARAGTAAHRVIELHLLKGEPLTGAARCTQKLCAELVKEPIAVEQPVAGGLKADGIPLVGKIDLVRWSRPEVLDWKSTSKPRSSALLLQGRDLIRTVQMPGYAQWFFDALPEETRVRLTHAYISSKWREPLIRSAEFWRHQVADRWGEVEGVARGLRQVARAERADDVPVNTNACGYCPYWGECSVNKGVTRVSLISELKKRKQGVLPPDAPKSGEAAPAAELMAPEELAAQPPAVQEAVKKFDLSDANTETRLEYQGEYVRATVTRVFNLGVEDGRIDVGLEMQLKATPDPKQPLLAMLAELDAVGAEYRARRKTK